MLTGGNYSKKILVVDDDESILLMIETVLKKEGYTNIQKASNAKSAVDMTKQAIPDLIILDVMLPDLDGYAVCKEIRTYSMVPIIFLSARSDESDKLISYALGGDEYMTKPFSPKELVAKISAMLTRQEYYEKHTEKSRKYEFGEYLLDTSRKLLLKNGRNIEITAKEYKLLEYFLENKNITLSKEKLLNNVWEMDYDGYENTVMVHIRHLREKIEEDPSNPVYLKTVKGRGYIFVV